MDSELTNQEKQILKQIYWIKKNPALWQQAHL